ncbi:MAG: wax ester/triacylglycerol synthase domain-containing protein, partial [Acidimicrobiales bacterium]
PTAAARGRTRPLWELTLFEGLDEDRAATVLKMHNVLMDGVGGLAVLVHVLDTEREPAIPAGASPVVPSASAPNAFETLVEMARYDTARAVRTGSGLLRSLPRGIGRSVHDPAGATREVVATAADFVRLVRPALTTRSPVMTDRRLGSHFEVLEVPLPQLKRAAKAAGGTLNDAFVAAIVGGLRIYHDKHGAPVERLRMVMTINVRGEQDAVGGNHVTAVRAEVPVATTDTLQRVREITDLCHRMRRDRSIPHINAVAAILNALPVAVMAGMLKHDDFIVSNVPGYPGPLYLGGARLDAFYGFGPTAGTAVNVTLLSYRDTCHIGINANAGAVSDPGLLRECLREGAEEVLSLADRRM